MQGVNDPAMNSGGQCAEGLKMIVVIGNLPNEDNPVTEISGLDRTASMHTLYKTYTHK